MLKFLSRSLMGPLRVAMNDELMKSILTEPLLFAAHYAAVTQLIAWPEHIETIVASVRSRYEKHDEVLALLKSMRGQVPVRELSGDHAISVAEGLESRHAVTHRVYQSLCRQALAQIASVTDDEIVPDDLTPSGRIARLAVWMDLSTEETKLLSYALIHTAWQPLQGFTKLFLRHNRSQQQLFWQVMLDLTSRELAEVLSSQGRLAGSGLLHAEEDQVPQVSDYFAKLLLKTETSLEEGIAVALAYKESPGGASRLAAEDRKVLVQLLHKPGTGINVLLYGKSAVDKTSLAYRLIREAGGTPYALAADIPSGDRPAAVMIAQRLLTEKNGQPVLVVQHTQTILTRTMPEGLFFFLMPEEDGEAKSRDEQILSGTPIPTVWITTDPHRSHMDTLARFLFHAEALKGTRADRKAMIESVIHALPVAGKYKAELAQLEGLSEQQLVSARTLAQMTAGRSRKTYAQNLILSATRSQKALSRRGKDEARIPVTTYSLDYINSSGRFGPGQILKAFKRKPLGSLCLYGLPGTGKTQFAEYLALELGKPILIKRASDILDKYLGESEKRIAEMFDQAYEEDAILLLDEADSFLRDRSRSDHHWEVTTVNELLQHMERFEGIFVCTTNLFAQIDMAALRRFTFKLEFQPLNIGQRWEMFQNEAGLRDKRISEKLSGQYEDQLALMKDLAPGDFATVKRQCLLLGETLSPEDWLEQLEIEVRAKKRSDPEQTGFQRAA